MRANAISLYPQFWSFYIFFACIAFMEWGLVIYNRVFFRNYRKSLINAAFVRNRSRRPAISNRICTCTAARGRSNVIFAPADSPNTPTWRTICFCIPVSTYFPALYYTIIFQRDDLLRIKTVIYLRTETMFWSIGLKVRPFVPHSNENCHCRD